MARMGVFSRNDSSPESVPRSLQLLNHRKSFDARYMEIYPNFTEILYPNESISINVTNFVRSIPMKRPMLSRVRVIQRFCAVPLRILWSSWEDYIKGENDSQFLLEEPYLVNMTSSGTGSAVTTDAGGGIVWNQDFNMCVCGGRAFLDSVSGNVATFHSSNIKGRGINLTMSSYVPKRLIPVDYTSTSPVDDDTREASCLFGVHELGDYLGFPLFRHLGKVINANGDKVSMPVSAFKFAAYQLAYSYFERSPNVQKRVDDFYQMDTKFSNVNGPVSGEYPNYVNNNLMVPCHDYYSSSQYAGRPQFNLACGVISKTATLTGSVPASSEEPRDISSNNDPNSATYQQDVIRSSWENVEKFPLKSGANMSMLAQYSDPNTGLPTYVPSNISLFRMRFANWQTDYFTSCNPWQQRGEEAQIPVSGSVTVNIGDLAVSISKPQETLTVNNRGVYWYSGNLDGPMDPFPVGATAIDGSIKFEGDSSGNLPDSAKGAVYIASPAVSSDRSVLGLKLDDSANVISPARTLSGTASGASASTSISGLYVSPSNFRFAMTLQHIKEMQAEIDNRYQSYIHKFFGARARDYRLDRPEFLGGSVMELNVSDVNQTSESTEDSSLGQVAGKSVSANTSRTIRFHADEHCVILGTIHIIPDTNYIDGLDRIDSTNDRFDWALPQFSHLSEQAVYNKELVYRDIFSDHNSLSNNDVFGYEPALNHLRWRKNTAVGAFRDTFNSLGNYAEYKPWLITRDFGSVIQGGNASFNVPTLSDEFLSGRYGRDNSNFDVTDDTFTYPFIVDSYFNERVTRVISTRGTPSRLGA